jgi:cell division protein FtsI/penicillin-binding protein 2
MAFSAQKGTGKAAGEALLHVSAMAKTGTAPCIHANKAPGDGFALVMSPADHPRAVLLVRLHGRPGSIAAGVAGRMIAAVAGSEHGK